ncbi:MAG TPA: hypothetical protein VFY75_00755 [Solirubrobacterales bacterium]|nr:hypothetical protein [Solirubrobacterales bacterium]
MKGITSVLVVALLALGLVACGGGETTSDEPATGSAEESAQIEALRLEKEKAEFEAQTAKAEAQSEAREAAKEARREATRSTAKAQAVEEQESEPEAAEPPDVVGLRLPQARAALSAAGYTTRAENTDTVFGIVVPSHYTVCEQSEPQGSVVTVLAQKYGC